MALSLQQLENHRDSLLNALSKYRYLPQFKKSAKEIGIEYGCTPIMTAVMLNDIKDVKKLLRADCKDINAMDKYGSSPLNKAIENNRVGIVRALMAHKRCDINIKDSILGKTPLMIAAGDNRGEIVRILLSNKKY